MSRSLFLQELLSASLMPVSICRARRRTSVGSTLRGAWLYINCDLQHVNKATGIDRLITQTGIEPERTAGIGDTMGDRFIAERVAWFGCPANAEPEIAKSAAFVSRHREVEGVIDILEQLSR